MSASVTVAMRRREMWRCCRCDLPAVQPKLLPCLHTFCLQCLKLELQQPDRSPLGPRMVCPQCSTQFVVPHQGLLGLTLDIFVERLVKMQKGLCDVCSDDPSFYGEVPSASKYCALCSQGLCERCSVEHSRQKLLKAHKLVDFSIETAIEQARLHPSNMCTKHSTVVSTQFFCLTCERFVCNVCLLEDHFEHKWSKWEEAAEKFRSNLQLNIDQVSGLLKDVDKRKKEIVGNEVHRFGSETSEVEFLIRERCRQLKEQIDRQENALLEELNCLKETRTQKIVEEVNEKFKRYQVQLETYENFCRAVTNNGAPNELEWAVNDLKLPERCEQLRNECDVFADSKTLLSSFVEVCFKLQDEDAILNNRALIGTVTSQTARHARLDTRGKAAWGVTSMNKFIYILCKDSIIIYDPENPSDPVQEMVIPQSKYLTDIAASPTDLCLYVTDQGNKYAWMKESCIWKIEREPETMSCKVSKWLTANFILFTLSVSPEGHIILSRSTKTQNQLVIYNRAGNEMETIDLPLEIEFPNHAIELTNKHFVVAFGKSGESEQGVWEINREGKVVMRFSFDALKNPWYLTVFTDGEILIADSYNNRVLWLDSSLKVKKQILTNEKDEIIKPRRMCYAKESNLLIIVHSEDIKSVVDLHDASRWLD